MILDVVNIRLMKRFVVEMEFYSSALLHEVKQQHVRVILLDSS